MSEVKIWIISSVWENCFADLPNKFWHTKEELASAMMDEKDVFIEPMWLTWLKGKVSIELVRAMWGKDELNKIADADMIVMGWSPSMADDDDPWIQELKDFVANQVSNWTQTLGICFWHQILASAFWASVEYHHTRNIWYDTVKVNQLWFNDKLFWQRIWDLVNWLDNSTFWSLWSHKQVVTDLWPSLIQLWANNHSPNQIIKVDWSDAWWVQFHPEFSPEFTTFLIKLMREDLENEWFNLEELIEKINKMWDKNPSSTVLENFVRLNWNPDNITEI